MGEKEAFDKKAEISRMITFLFGKIDRQKKAIAETQKLITPNQPNSLDQHLRKLEIGLELMENENRLLIIKLAGKPNAKKKKRKKKAKNKRRKTSQKTA